MATDKPMTQGSFWNEMLQWGLYKKTQGKVTRQVTLSALLILFATAAWRLNSYLTGAEWFAAARFIAPGVLLAIGTWFAFRVVNVPRFADFLIAVEAEMNKVSWPSKAELYRSSIVVIFVLFALSAVLFGFDIFWKFIFEWIGVLAPAGAGGSS
jgi:preprotein translocase subunit SecE